jgi:DNA polymerase-1
MAATILVDGNAIGNHYHHATKLTVGTFETQAIFGFTRLMRDLANAYAVHDLIVLWDGEAQRRLELLPGYKASRKAAEAVDPEKAKNRSAYRAQVPIIQKSMQALGVRQMKCHTLEADDLGGYLSQKLSAAGQNVLLVTGDSDWWQLINERVTWLDPRESGRRVNISNFLEQTGFHTPKEYLQAKALMGDRTDDIPPAGGIGEKGAQEFMARFKSVPAFWAQCDAGTFAPTTKALQWLWKGTSPHTKEAWAAMATPEQKADAKSFKKYMETWPGDTRNNWIRNMKLMSLLNVPKPDVKDMHIDGGTYDADKFKAICERLVFASILKDFDNFVTPFHKQWSARQVKAA